MLAKFSFLLSWKIPVKISRIWRQRNSIFMKEIWITNYQNEGTTLLHSQPRQHSIDCIHSISQNGVTIDPFPNTSAPARLRLPVSAAQPWFWMYTPKQVYTSFLGCIHPVSWGNLHGCTLMALLNWYQLVFKLSFSYFDKLFCGILLDFVCLYFSLFIFVTLAYYVDNFHLQKFMHFCVVYHLLWSYYLYILFVTG